MPPDYQPFADDEEDRRRKAEIEEMMRSQRESYFRDEPVQQEYRDIVDRMASRKDDAETPQPARTPGVFDLALQQYMKKRAGEGANVESATNPRPQFASLDRPTGVILRDDGAGDANDPFSPDAIRNSVAFGFNQTDSNDEPSASPQPYRVAQAAPALTPASGASSLFDGGEAEARSIFRRDAENPDEAAKTVPDAGVGKGDRWPVSNPKFSPSAVDLRRDGGSGPPLRRQDDPARAFEVEPFERDGVDRVTQMQGEPDKQGRYKDRPYAIQEVLRERLNIAAQKTGLVVEVHSGGQVAKGEEGNRLKDSSPRHDHGNAGDVDLFEIVNGSKRKLDARRPDDRKKMADFIQYSVAAGATGIGFGYGYMGPSRVHIGGGSEMVWGNTKRDKKLNIPPAWVVEAVDKGKAMHAVAGAVTGAEGPIDGFSGSLRKPYGEGPSPEVNNTSADGRTLSLMREMVERSILARGFKKGGAPNWPGRNGAPTRK